MVPRKLVVYLAAVACSFAATPPACVGSLPVGSFRLTVQPEKGGAVRPLRLLNNLKAGEKLRYEPVKIPDAFKQKAQVALVLVPPSQSLVVLDPHSASKSADWRIPQDTSVVALVFGPNGLSVKKVKSLIERNEEILTQLADYAEQTEKVEMLVQTVAKSEAAGANLDAALAGFSAQYGLALPRIDTRAPSDQQAGLLLRALMPSVAAYDPLNPRSTVQQSTGLAASLAAMFFGTPVGLVAGGASLFQNLRLAIFPNTEFRSAIAHPADADAMALCAKPQAAKAHTRIAYLWAHRVPGFSSPAPSISDAPHVPLTLKSAVKGTGLQHLERAHDWRLVAASSSASFPVNVTCTPDALTLDLAQSKAPPGEYRLAAQWDWEPVILGGTVNLHPLDGLASARLEQASQDRLLESAGRVPIEVTGADFQFVEKVAIEKDGKRRGEPAPLEFTLPKGKRGGEQRTLETEIDTNAWRRGRYRLLLTQADQKTRAVPVTIHAPMPKFDNLPLRLNLGEGEQPLDLRGASLDRIERIATPAGEVTLAAGSATIKLREGLKAGQEFPIELKLHGIDQPAVVAKAIVIAGWRPRITAVRKSSPGESAAALHKGEVPAAAPVSFELSVEHLAPGAVVDLTCGDKTVRVPARPAGAGALFFAIDPGTIGHSGCKLAAIVTVAATGASKAMPLGRVVRLPRIEQFHLTDEKLSDSSYAGIIEGRDLETIARTGWDDQNGLPVEGLPTANATDPQRQTLRIALPWPAPSPHAPLYIWLRGEDQGRPTGVKY